MLRRKIALAWSRACKTLLVAPGTRVQELPPACDQPDYGRLHAEPARAHMVGSEHVPDLADRGFSACVP